MKKKLVLTGLSALAVLTLASCNSGPKEEGKISYQGLDESYTYEAVPTADSYAENAGNVDIYINYNGESGITFRGTSWNNVVDGMTYTQGSLLPTWTRIQELTKTNIREASGYRASNLDNAYTSIATAGYKSETNASQNIDLFYNSTTNLRTAGNAGSLVDLNKYLEEGKLPNLKAYLDANPAIKKAITTSGKIYYAPYLDGDNDVEKTLIMDTAMVKKVLSEAAKGDTTTNGGQNPAKNVVQTAKYKKFIDNDTLTVDIVENGVKENKPVDNTVQNIIDQQNTLLENGCTGKELAEQLVNYINQKYTFYGAGNEWQLYVGEKAAYNTDELVALMRVIKANPGLLTGNPDAEIEVFFPRGETASSINSVVELLQLWGVQGVDAENGNFYFSADGKLNAVETTQAAYEGLKYLSALYDEGLILENFYASSATSTANRYLDQYFKKTATTLGYGFMMYDDPTIVTVANDVYEGIGTTSRGTYTEKVESIYSVLPPRTYWTTTGNNSQKPLTTTEGKTLERYYESNRSLQTTSWGIPANSDNVEGALRIIDFMYSKLGQLIQNYGPEAYWEKTDQVVTNMTANGEKNAIVSFKTKLELVSSQRDFWSFMRGYLGASHGIGHVRLSGLNLQATNHYGQIGLKDVQTAIQAGVVAHATNKDTLTWDASVPTQFNTSVSDDKNEWDGITGFWAVNKLNKNEGWVNVVVSPCDTDNALITIKTFKNLNLIKYEDMLAQQEKYNTICLREYANSLGADCIPDYAKK